MNKNTRAKAKHDITYCVCKDCKEKCWRHEDNYEFDTGLYSFMAYCEDYKGEINRKKYKRIKTRKRNV